MEYGYISGWKLNFSSVFFFLLRLSFDEVSLCVCLLLPVTLRVLALLPRHIVSLFFCICHE